MKWQNVGSAPCYRPYRVGLPADETGGLQKVFVSKMTVNKWLPGSIELFTEEFFKQPADLPPGEVAEVRDAIRLPDDLVSRQLHRFHCRGGREGREASRATWDQGPSRRWMVSVEQSVGHSVAPFGRP